MITDVPGVRVGHATDPDGLTGCTVVIPSEAAVAGVDVRGGAPGTRETDLLRPGRLVQRVNAVLLTGGSAFGLAAAEGVMRWLEERGMGYETGAGPVPIVPAAVLFDLQIGRRDRRPDAEMGYRACQAATDGPVAEGNVGAGTGATVGKVLGLGGAMRGGLGTASERLPGGCTVGALAVVNCLGDVYDADSGRRVAGTRDPLSGRPVDGARALRERAGQPPAFNTTLAVVATDARLDPAAATRVAEVAHDGMARVIRPVHTQFDGDTVFVLSTGPRRVDLTALAMAAADVVARAIVRGVKAATGVAGIPSWRDLAHGS